MLVEETAEERQPHDLDVEADRPVLDVIQVVLDALKSARGNRAKAARLLGTTERIFNYRVRKYGIDWRRFKM